MKRFHISHPSFPLSVFRFPLTLLLAVLFASCEKVVEFDVEDTERQVVVNALPCADSTLFVNVTYSRFFLDNQPFAPVGNATISIDVNGVAYTAANRDGANYIFPYQAASGDTLTIHVAVPGHDEIVGGTRIPPLPAMDSLIAEIDTLQPITAGNISFNLDDPEGENYYYIFILERDSGSRWNNWEEKWDTIDTVRHAYFNCLNHEVTDPEVNSAEGFMDYFSMLLFNDANIDGTSAKITLTLSMFKDTAEHPLMRQYTLVVESLSKEAHQYIKEINAASGMSSYFAEPSQIYSNLSSGLGIFAGIARRQIPIVFTYKEQEPATSKSPSRPAR